MPVLQIIASKFSPRCFYIVDLHKTKSQIEDHFISFQTDFEFIVAFFSPRLITFLNLTAYLTLIGGR